MNSYLMLFFCLFLFCFFWGVPVFISYHFDEQEPLSIPPQFIHEQVICTGSSVS